MRSVGIICEYNPFHNGHLRQIELLREKNAEAVVCLMSGNVTQRGEFACADKYTRARAALASGADLVLELPYPYSAASAEFFAAAGVCMLDALGVDEINFGSESGDAEKLRRSAERTATADFINEYKKLLSDSPIGSAAAYAEAYRRLYGEELSDLPNDLLAVAYFKAAHRAKISIELTTVKRIGDGFSETELKGGEYPSATALRGLFFSKETEMAFSNMPSSAAEVYREALEKEDAFSDIHRIETSVLSFFRTTDPKSLEGIAEAGGGVAQRLCAASRKATSLDGLFELSATKRYTRARLQRAVMFCMTGVTEEDLREEPKYTTLLAANKVGRKFLSSCDSSSLKIITKPADSPECRQKELSIRADSLYTLTLPRPKEADEYLRRFPKISEND